MATSLRDGLKELAGQHRRHGYRMLHSCLLNRRLGDLGDRYQTIVSQL
jgi:hypothetical protein